MISTLIALGAASEATGQDRPVSASRQEVGGFRSQLPVVPPLAPRPAESEQQFWQTNRAGPDLAPAASFIESLRGNDAVVELVSGQSRILTTKRPIAAEDGVAIIAVGDPTIVDFDVLPNPRMVRLLGKRAGITDLTFTTAEGQTFSFEVHVLYDLKLLEARLRETFPDALVKVSQIREHLVLEGQARSTVQINQIERVVQAFLQSAQVPGSVQGAATAVQPNANAAGATNYDQGGVPPDGTEQNGQFDVQNPTDGAGLAFPETIRPNVSATFASPQVINLMTIPGVQQVMLQVRIAELNRTALREIGADVFIQDGSGNTIGTQIAGAAASLMGLDLGTATTGFGIFPSGELQIFLRALRRNSILTILAEPNLIAMHGQEASFLAGGEFAVPVPQAGGIGVSTITIQFKQFGVQLNFVPYILDDETIRLRVRPEASTIDESLGTEVQGTVVPGVNTRRVDTTVELREGETLALAGLLTVDIDGQTSRIPGLGDLPYIGRMFSNTSHRRVEKELVVLVTPHLVSPVKHKAGPLPGEDIAEPNDLEFYLMGRIEGRTGRPFRSTTNWDDPLHFVELMRLESSQVCGPAGFSK